jgi:hypothetical protein
MRYGEASRRAARVAHQRNRKVGNLPHNAANPKFGWLWTTATPSGQTWADAATAFCRSVTATDPLPPFLVESSANASP